MEIYDQKKLYELIKDFYTLVGLKVCIYDRTGEELVFYPKKLSSFCALLREDKDMDERCRKCDKKAFAECTKTYRQYVYTCHAGLMECMSPIIFDKEIIGYMVLGQIKSSENSEFDKIADRLPKEKLSELKKCYDNLPIIEMEKLGAAMRIVDACTGYEYLKSLVSASDKQIDKLIGKYINDNLNKDLSVSSICSEFRLSHSEVYSIFKEYFDSTPAEYIKKRRLAKACEMLENTDLSINVIGRKCGFPDYNYFSKVFKRAYGISPRNYRNKMVERAFR